MEPVVADDTMQETIHDRCAVEQTSRLKMLQGIQPSLNKNTKPVISGEDEITPIKQYDTKQSIFSGNKRQLKVFDDNIQSKHSIAAVKPVVRSYSVDSERQHNTKGGQPVSEHRNKRHSDWECEDEIALPCIKIDQLELGRFKVKQETENTKISYNRKENKVVFKAMSFDELKELKLKMYECLDSVTCEVKTLTEQRYHLLRRADCLEYLQSKSRELENITVLYKCDTHRKAIRCFGFTEREARKGLQLLEEEITQFKINVKPSQVECLSNSTWMSLLKSLDVDLTSVFVAANEETIVVEGLIEQEATTTYNGILRYLKDNMKVTQVSAILESSKARCFQTRFENKLRHQIQTKGGKLDVVTLEEDPLKLQVSVDGEEAIGDELNQVIDLIWQEHIDIRSISSQADDVWLLRKGLKSPCGREFTLRFEQTHTCFLDVSVVEENVDLNSWGATDDFSDYDEQVFEPDTNSLSAAACNTHVPEKVKHSAKDASNSRRRRKFKGAKFRHYQAGLSEEEALQMALLQSVESANVEDCIIKTSKNVQPDWHTNVKNVQPDCHANVKNVQPDWHTYVKNVQPDWHTNVKNVQPDWHANVNNVQPDWHTNVKNVQPDWHANVKNVQPDWHTNVKNVQPDWHTNVKEDPAVLQSCYGAVYHFTYGEEDNRSVYLRECTLVCETKAPASTVNAAPRCGCHECQDQTPDNYKPAPESGNLNMFGAKVQLIHGQIIQHQADALVNVMSWTENAFDGPIPKSFLDAGGEMLLQMYECVESASAGTIVVTGSSGQLQQKCSTIFHVKMKSGVPYKKMVSQAVSEIFDECANWNCSSVAMPPIGVDKLSRYPSADVAEIMLSEIRHQLQAENNKVKTILLVVDDDATYTVFDEAITTYTHSSVYDNHQAFQKEPKDNASKYKLTNFLSNDGTCDKRSTFNTRRTGSTSYDKISGNTASCHTPGRHNKHIKGKKKRDTTRRLKHSSHRMSSEINALGVSAESISEAEDVDDPVPSLKVTITAENKGICMKAAEAFENRAKREFLHEEIVEKKCNISDKGKHVIEKIVTTNDIKFMEGKGCYMLKGHEEMVRKACTEIRKIVLEESSNMLVSKTRHSGIHRDPHEFIEDMMDNEPEVPKYWRNYKQGKSLSSLLVSAKHFVTRSKFELVELGRGMHAFSSIIKMINATFDDSLVGKGKDAEGLDGFEYKKLFVLKIERVENLDLYESFTRKRQTFYRRLYKSGDLRFPTIDEMPKCTGGIATTSYVHPALDQDIHSEINEYLLFHGTKEEHVTTICNDGLDPRIGKDNSMFGKGIYAAECATKADQYADAKNRRSAGKGNIKNMFLIRMVLGNSYVCTKKNPSKFRRPPCTTCIKDDCNDVGHAGKFGHAYDSVVGDNKKLFREFIVYDSSLCYPEYLITYERR